MKILSILLLIFSFALNCFSQTGNKDSLVTAIQRAAKDSAVTPKHDTIPYVTLYFYRSYIPKFVAPIKKVPIYVNDSLVTDLKANTMAIFKVFKEGKINIAIDKKGDSEITIKAKFGKEYFFRCAIETGLWGGKPAFEQVTPEVGKAETGVFKNE